jgi:Uma2 family endonuclease
MAVLAIKTQRLYGPDSAGVRLTLAEFDRARFVDGWRYELIQGVLVVTPIPLEQERDPNGELEYLLRRYREDHPQGASLNKTLYEHTVRTHKNRRRADRAIWAGLGRLPRRHESPTVIAEFVSAGKRDRKRDYEDKRDEYMAFDVKEYWIIDRFERTMTVFRKVGSKVKKTVLREHQVYTTELLPGFELPLARLGAAADDWEEREPDD